LKPGGPKKSLFNRRADGSNPNPEGKSPDSFFEKKKRRGFSNRLIPSSGEGGSAEEGRGRARLQQHAKAPEIASGSKKQHSIRQKAGEIKALQTIHPKGQ